MRKKNEKTDKSSSFDWVRYAVLCARAAAFNLSAFVCVANERKSFVRCRRFYIFL